MRRQRILWKEARRGKRVVFARKAVGRQTRVLHGYDVAKLHLHDALATIKGMEARRVHKYTRISYAAWLHPSRQLRREVVTLDKRPETPGAATSKHSHATLATTPNGPHPTRFELVDHRVQISLPSEVQCAIDFGSGISAATNSDRFIAIAGEAATIAVKDLSSTPVGHGCPSKISPRDAPRVVLWQCAA